MENSGGVAHRVATKGANSWGLYDMHGNVWEWVGDWHHYYLYLNRADLGGVVENPRGPWEPPLGSLDDADTDRSSEPLEFRVVRGGSFRFEMSYARCESRAIRDEPFVKNENLGFRVRFAAGSE